jgi:hypothetical protein
MKYNFLIFISYIAAPKFCINCVHFSPHPKLGNKFGYCSKFPLENPNDEFLITGEIFLKPVESHYCSTARKLDHMCGERAHYFFPNMEE